MTFVYDEKTQSVYDRETDSYLVYAKNEDGYDLGAQDYRTFLFRQGTLECLFKKLTVSERPDESYLQPHMRNYMPNDAQNEAKAGSTINIILEDSLREGLALGLIKIGKPYWDEEYQKIRAFVEAGFKAFNIASESQKDFPGRKYFLEFSENMSAAAAKYPGKFPNYERMVKANSNMPQAV